MLAVVVQHRVVESVDAFEILRVEHVLRTGPGRRMGAQVGREQRVHRLKDGQVSEMIDTGSGLMVIKRIKALPPRADVTFAQKR